MLILLNPCLKDKLTYGLVSSGSSHTLVPSGVLGLLGECWGQVNVINLTAKPGLVNHTYNYLKEGETYAYVDCNRVNCVVVGGFLG